MITKITSKIQNFSVKEKPETATESPAHEEVGQEVVMKVVKPLDRPEILAGTTYKLTVPDHISKHSLYVTINNIELEEGTIRPFEIFINSKSLQNSDWVAALTRITSAVFRLGGDFAFIVEELRAIYSPEGGYYNNGKFHNSLLNEIGNIIERHFTETCGEDKPQFVDEVEQAPEISEDEEASKIKVKSINTPQATMGPRCPSCGSFNFTKNGGCETCMDCGYSKCG